MTQKTGKHTKREQDYHVKILAKLNQQQTHEKPERTGQNNQGRRK